MREDGKVDYVELPGGELPATKAFYASAFGWAFTDYGPTYAAFNEGLDGGPHLRYVRVCVSAWWQSSPRRAHLLREAESRRR